MATFTHVQTVCETGNQITPDQETVAFGSNVTAGSLLVVGQAGSGDPGAVPTDTLGNTYTQIGSFVTTGNGMRLAWWWCVTEDGGANTVTFPTMGTFDAAFVSEFTVDAGTIELDDSDGTTFSGDDPTGNTMTATVDGTLVLGAICSDQGAGVTYDPGTNFTERGTASYQGSANDTLAFESRQLSSAGSVTAPWITSASDSGAIVGAVFRADAGQTPPFANVTIRG